MSLPGLSQAMKSRIRMRRLATEEKPKRRVVNGWPLTVPHDLRPGRLFARQRNNQPDKPTNQSAADLMPEKIAKTVVVRLSFIYGRRLAKSSTRKRPCGHGMSRIDQRAILKSGQPTARFSRRPLGHPKWSRKPAQCMVVKHICPNPLWQKTTRS